MAPRVVVVDPDMEHVARCRQFLSSAGYDVVATSDVAAAREAFASAAAVIVDVDLVSDSLGALRNVAEQGGAAIFGMTEVLAGELNRAVAMHHDGLADLWLKPLSEGDVLGWMQRVAPVARRAAQPTPAVVPSITAEMVAQMRGESLAPPPPPGDRLVAREGGMPWEAGAPAAIAAAAAVPVSVVPPVVRRQADRLSLSTVAEEGTLEEHALATVIAWLGYRQATGALMLQSGNAKKMVTFVSGFPVSARSSADSTTFEQKLVADGIVRPDQVDAARRFAQSRGIDVGDALLAVGVLEPDDLAALRTAHLEQLVVDAFDWTDGVYSFRASSPPAGSPEPFVGPMDVVWAGVGRVVSVEVLRADLSPALGRTLTRAADPGALEGLGFSRSQQELVDAVSRGVAVRLAATAPEAVLRAAYLLIATGIAKVSG